MKNLILSIFVLTFTFANAQTDKMVTTKMHEETKVTDNGLVYKTKVKVITEKTKNPQFNLDQRYQLNQDRVASPVIVTKKIMIDNDMDPFFDNATEVKYLKYKDNKYGFLIDGDERVVTYKLNDENINFANMIETADARYDDISTLNLDEVGYFNDDNEFVIEYYDVIDKEEEAVLFGDLKM